MIEKDGHLTLLKHERKVLLEKINSTIVTFDKAIADLRQERFKLTADLKTTDMKLLTHYQELKILQEFGGREEELNKKLQKCRAEKAEVVVDLTECQDKLSAKLQEIQAWQEKDKRIMGEFNSIVGGDKSEFYVPLLKIFKRRIKRAKKKSGDDDADEDEDDDNYESDEDFFDEDDESSSDDEDESCPKDCDNGVYEKVLELREKRLDQEEILQEFNKSVEELKGLNQSLQQKEKNIDKSLKATEQDIQLFQNEKQRSLNQIIVAIPLKLSQVRCLDSVGRLPTEPSAAGALVFTRSRLERLRDRIRELQQEKLNCKKDFLDLKREHKQLTKAIRVKQVQIDGERKKCEDVQLLKFGQLIDLEMLERAGSNEAAQKLRTQLEKMERDSARKLVKWDNEIRKAEDDLSMVTYENTRSLEKVAELTKMQYTLEDQLNAASKNIHVQDTGPMERKHTREMQQLVELAKAQATEIDALKAEIHMLQRKGGHLYGIQPESPPVTGQPGGRPISEGDIIEGAGEIVPEN
eukprot:985844_1